MSEEKIEPEKGDLVDVAPHREGVYGVRVGRVTEIYSLHTREAWVSVSGEPKDWLVSFQFLTVVYRPS